MTFLLGSTVRSGHTLTIFQKVSSDVKHQEVVVSARLSFVMIWDLTFIGSVTEATEVLSHLSVILPCSLFMYSLCCLNLTFLSNEDGGLEQESACGHMKVAT